MLLDEATVQFNADPKWGIALLAQARFPLPRNSGLNMLVELAKRDLLWSFLHLMK